MTDDQGAASTETLRFPEGFLWGAATASYQYEGEATHAQWYAWEQAGHIVTGDRSGLACDWWRDAERDFDLARDLGLNALRLSLEWSRIEPRPGEWDDAALARYRRMLVGLRERGITPMVTLHHFTHPLWFEERGGWLTADAPERFEAYVRRAADALHDLCDLWCTINEPNVFAVQGYLLGEFPPGRKGDALAVLRVQANMARGHARAYRALKQIDPAARVGWAQHYNLFDPARPTSALDRLAASIQDAGFNDFFPRAVRTGAAAFPFALVAGDLRDVRGTTDFLGINLYYRDLVRFDLRAAGQLFGRRFTRPGAPMGDGTVFGEVYPETIRRVAARLRPLGLPIYITEHGVADREDRIRPWLLVQAARAMSAAVAEGADLRGYFHWSLVDNFEWALGWSMRFGLVALDPATQVRTPRPSAALYAALARANALTPAMAADIRAPEGALPIGHGS